MNVPILTKEMADMILSDTANGGLTMSEREGLAAIAQERANVVSLDSEDVEAEFWKWIESAGYTHLERDECVIAKEAFIASRRVGETK